MSEKILQLNDGIIRNELKKLARNSVEKTLNDLLEKEAKGTNVEKYERTAITLHRI